MVLGSLGKKFAPGVAALRLADLGRGLTPGCEAGVRPVMAWWAQLGSGDPLGHRTGLNLCMYSPEVVPSWSSKSLDP